MVPQCDVVTLLVMVLIVIPETLKYWVGVQRGHSYLMGRTYLFSLGGHPSSDGVTIIIPYGVDVLLHGSALHTIFSYWIG